MPGPLRPAAPGPLLVSVLWAAASVAVTEIALDPIPVAVQHRSGMLPNWRERRRIDGGVACGLTRTTAFIRYRRAMRGHPRKIFHPLSVAHSARQTRFPGCAPGGGRKRRCTSCTASMTGPWRTWASPTEISPGFSTARFGAAISRRSARAAGKSGARASPVCRSGLAVIGARSDGWWGVSDGHAAGHAARCRGRRRRPIRVCGEAGLAAVLERDLVVQVAALRRIPGWATAAAGACRAAGRP